jgi:hypothetical protein
MYSTFYYSGRSIVLTTETANLKYAVPYLMKNHSSEESLQNMERTDYFRSETALISTEKRTISNLLFIQL